MTTRIVGSSIVSVPLKRKRAKESLGYDEEFSDVESCDVWKSPLTIKKARLLATDLDADSDPETPPAPSLVETTTATINDTEYPISEATSLKSKARSRPKRYLCTFAGCDKAFDRPIRLQTHFNSHTGERPYACSERDCDKKFFKAEHLKQHIHDKHTAYSGFQCSFQLHDNQHGGLITCGKTFPTSTKLKRHLAQHEQKEETTCSWDGCGKVFRKQETLQRHIKKDHLNETSYQCSAEVVEGGICGQFFATPGQLRGHKAQAHDEPRFWCDLCTAAVNDSTCDMDGVEDAPLAYGGELAAQEHDSDDGILRTLSPQVAMTSGMQLGIGSAGFRTYPEFQSHMKQCHPPTCAECGKACKTNRELTAHMDIEHPQPDEHTTHKRDRRFLCPFEGCSRADPDNGFAKKGNMVVHFKTVHAKEKSFTCGEFDLGDTKRLEGWNGQGCGLALKTKQSLMAHIRTQHLGVPAAIGVRTGLRDEDRKRKIRPGRRSVTVVCADAMEVDTQPVRPESGATISLLTGAGYETRPFACLHADSHGCQMRFVKTYDLSYHLEMSHGWNIDDINDAIHFVDPSAPGSSGQTFAQMLQWESGTVSALDSPENLDPRLK